ncbi:ABC transporter substrate-binding protein [Paenibacillus oceani]|uniref:Extracellular solute-binding protein n=1 Tax=Paenibacillus oceani TaxID=2772510 RepID=A0A927CCJ4_9BACL|nr:extracellular solute-binding protein [Paenibacillus oceani]MBD2865125.1 extracellular solute-binding protein [Paenibacillus oceani]
MGNKRTTIELAESRATKNDNRRTGVKLAKFAKNAAIFGLLAAVASACSGANTGGSTTAGTAVGTTDSGKVPEVKKKEPVDLVFFQTSSGWTEAMFMEQYGDAIKTKFPHMNIKFIPSAKTTDLIASGTTIDVLFSSVGHIHAHLIANNMQYDMTELIKKNNYDLNQLEPSTVELMKKIANGGMYGLPVTNTVSVLSYNKDLFDKFGVSYPKDGMTWDDTYELAKRMTRTEGGVNYRGLVASVEHIAQTNQFSAGYVDPKTDKSLFATNENWKKIADNLSRFYKIPGNEVDSKTGVLLAQVDAFRKDLTVAMMAHLAIPDKKDAIKNWDMVKLPEFKELPGVGSQPYPTYFDITSMSKHKDEAFEAIAFLTSEEFQLKLAKRGDVPVHKSQAVRNAFGQEVEHLKGKNIKARLPEKLAEPMAMTTYDAQAKTKWVTHMNQLITGTGNDDINTLLRKAAEEADKDIETIKASKK